MSALRKKIKIFESRNPEPILLNKKRKRTNEESNETLIETCDINKRKKFRKPNKKLRKNKPKIQKLSPIIKNKRRISRRIRFLRKIQKKEKFLEIRDNAKELIGESESSEYGKVIVAKDYDDDETERKGRKIKKSMDNKYIMKIDNIKNYQNEINDLKSLLQNALQQQDSKLESKIKELKNEIDEQNKKIYLLSEICKESNKFSKKIGNIR
jgi:hypothetical protein